MVEDFTPQLLFCFYWDIKVFKILILLSKLLFCEIDFVLPEAESTSIIIFTKSHCKF